MAGDLVMATKQMHMMKSVYFLAMIVIIVMACNSKKDVVATPQVTEPVVEIPASTTDENDSKDTLLYYHRGACFGMCPIFDLLVYKNGDAIYIGRNYVDRIGTYRTHISSADLQKITSAANNIGYFGFQDVYDNPHVTDLPTTVTMITGTDGKIKRVAARYKSPPALKTLYQEIDAMIELQTWKLSETKR